MTIDLSTKLQQVLVDACVDLWDGGVLELRTGAPPGADQADGGTLVASITLPTPAYGAAASADPASAAISGTWQDPSADNNGTVAHFRIKQSGDAGGSSTTDERIEGSVTGSGGGGDIEMDNIVVVAGQQIDVSSLPITHGN